MPLTLTSASKLLSRKLPTLLLLLVLFGVAALHAAPESPDPILGKWVWNGSMIATFNADGTCGTDKGDHGTWRFLNNQEVERKYRLVWNGGLAIDNLVFSRDAQKGRVINQKGERFEVQRAVEAAAVAADSKDPIIGKWVWPSDTIATFAADGTCTTDRDGLHGTWQFLHNPEVGRKYRVNWNQGLFINSLTLSDDGQKLRILDSKNQRYEARRTVEAAAVAADPKDPFIGTWAWQEDHFLVTFKPDGTFTVGSETTTKGTWQYLRNPEVERKYHLVWEQGKGINDLTLSRDGQKGQVRSPDGSRFDVRRIPPG